MKIIYIILNVLLLCCQEAVCSLIMTLRQSRVEDESVKRMEEPHKSKVIYSDIFNRLFPLFRDYKKNEFIIRNSAGLIESQATFTKDAREEPKGYRLELEVESPSSSIEYEGGHYLLGSYTEDSRFFIKKCYLRMPFFKSRYKKILGRRVPHTLDEAYFIMSRELAHMALATPIKWSVELDCIHYPHLRKNREYCRCHATAYKDQLYRHLWPQKFRDYIVLVNLLAISLGGPQAIAGGISYIVRNLVYAYKKGSTLSFERRKKSDVDICIMDSTYTLRNILMWLFDKEVGKVATYEASIKAQERVRVYYTDVVRDTPYFKDLDNMDKGDILRVGIMKSDRKYESDLKKSQKMYYDEQPSTSSGSVTTK